MGWIVRISEKIDRVITVPHCIMKKKNDNHKAAARHLFLSDIWTDVRHFFIRIHSGRDGMSQWRLWEQPWKQGSLGQHGAHLGPTGPRWAPCWPNESCYLWTILFDKKGGFALNLQSIWLVDNKWYIHISVVGWLNWRLFFYWDR